MARKGRASVTKGEKCGKAKLTEAQVRDIKTSKENGPSIAQRYGIGTSTVYGIRNGKRWQHLA